MEFVKDLTTNIMQKYSPLVLETKSELCDSFGKLISSGCSKN